MPLNSQQEADLLLGKWQALRVLPPENRIERLLADFFLSEEDSAYENVMRSVTRQMEDM